MGEASLEFTKSPSGGQTVITFSSYPNIITGASYASDPIIGKYQVMYISSHPLQYDYTLEKEIAPGVWQLVSETSTVALAASGDPRVSTNYLTGLATATTIDFNTGTVTWSTVEQLTVLTANLPSSQVLADFSNYSVGTLSYTFSTTDELKTWIKSTTKNDSVFKTSYWTRLEGSLSGVPEPGVWMLILTGLAVFSIFYRSVKARGHVMVE